VHHHHAGSQALLRGAMCVALVVALTGGGGPSGAGVSMANEPSAFVDATTLLPARGAATYTLLQMNLCLSGFAGCYGKVAYPSGVRDAVARIDEARPDAVTLNETCHADVARIARRTGYHLRFSAVTAAGRPLGCVRPAGRGVYGDAVLTRAAVDSARGRAFAAQAGGERRRWLCVGTRTGVDVCTAHLATRSAAGVAANDAQCAELAGVLERRAAGHTVVFGGDVNRRRACAPARAWVRTDASAAQAAGLQSVYGSGALRSPAAAVVPTIHTDHDVLLVRARLAGASRPPS
jgi:endonuclease/exonuclease/phosphatase family metal-dependent hydrolase